MPDPIPLFPIVTKSDGDSFNRFWAAYPRRKDKLDAQRAWVKAIKIATPEEIIAGAMRYAKTAVEPFIKLPATFLNKGSWMDEEPAPASVASSNADGKAVMRQAMERKAAAGDRFSMDWLKRNP